MPTQDELDRIAEELQILCNRLAAFRAVQRMHEDHHKVVPFPPQLRAEPSRYPLPDPPGAA